MVSSPCPKTHHSFARKTIVMVKHKDIVKPRKKRMLVGSRPPLPTDFCRYCKMTRADAEKQATGVKHPKARIIHTPLYWKIIGVHQK